MILWWARILVWVAVLVSTFYVLGRVILAGNIPAAVFCTIPFGVGLVGLMIAYDQEK